MRPGQQSLQRLRRHASARSACSRRTRSRRASSRRRRPARPRPRCRDRGRTGSLGFGVPLRQSTLTKPSSSERSSKQNSSKSVASKSSKFSRSIRNATLVGHADGSHRPPRRATPTITDALAPSGCRRTFWPDRPPRRLNRVGALSRETRSRRTAVLPRPGAGARRPPRERGLRRRGLLPRGARGARALDGRRGRAARSRGP